MANYLKIGPKTLIPMIFFAADPSKTNALLSLLSARLNMDKKVYRRISDNIYKTLQEHKEATRELEKIKISKGMAFFALNCRNGRYAINP